MPDTPKTWVSANRGWIVIFITLVACILVSVVGILCNILHPRSENKPTASNRTKHEQTAFEMGMMSYSHKIPPWANPYKDNSGSISWLEGWIRAKQDHEDATLKATNQQQAP